MTFARAAFAALILFAAGAHAAPLTLTPASPQPDAGALKPGLYVEYIYPPDVRTLREASEWKAGKTRGPDLVGFDYPDTAPGEHALTSDQEERVIAHIKGYLRFDEAGVHEIDVLSNDGISLMIGGQEVARFDGRQPCDNTGVTEVNAPEAGWYEVKALFFQRLNTSCLLMEWRPPSAGEMDWTPNENFAYLD